MIYEVYGYYSDSEAGRPSSFLGEYKSRSDAEDAVRDFENVRGRIAWVEEISTLNPTQSVNGGTSDESSSRRG